MAIPRGVPRMVSTRTQSRGAGAWEMMYLGMEMAMSFSPLSTGRGEGPKDLTNMGLLAARPLTNFIHSASEAKIPDSFIPTSQEMVVAWEDGSGMTILSFRGL